MTEGYLRDGTEFSLNTDGYWEYSYNYLGKEILIWLDGDQAGPASELLADCNELIESAPLYLRRQRRSSWRL